MNRKELLETFRLYQKMVEDKARREWEEQGLKERLYIGLLLFFSAYSVLVTIGMIIGTIK